MQGDVGRLPSVGAFPIFSPLSAPLSVSITMVPDELFAEKTSADYIDPAEDPICNPGLHCHCHLHPESLSPGPLTLSPRTPLSIATIHNTYSLLATPHYPHPHSACHPPTLQRNLHSIPSGAALLNPSPFSPQLLTQRLSLARHSLFGRGARARRGHWRRAILLNDAQRLRLDRLLSRRGIGETMRRGASAHRCGLLACAAYLRTSATERT